MKKLALVVAAAAGLFLFSGAARADHYPRPVQRYHHDYNHHSHYQDDCRYDRHDRYDRYNRYDYYQPARSYYVEPVRYYATPTFVQPYYASPRISIGFATPNFQLYLRK